MRRFPQILTIILSVFSSMVYAQTMTNFEPRYQSYVRGDFTVIANNVVSLDATVNYDGNQDNHDITSVFVDIDTDASTFNSSQATLSNPLPAASCLDYVKVLLYWSGANKEYDATTGNGGTEPNWDFRQVKVKLPGDVNYRDMIADEVIFNGRDLHFWNDPYVCVKDITSEVSSLANPHGNYTVGNVKVTEGILESHTMSGANVTGTSGGWQIVFVYQSPTSVGRQITLFDGYTQISPIENNFDVSIDGFTTIENGPVNANIMFGAFEGDRVLTGDALQIIDTNGQWVPLSVGNGANTLRAEDNFFNSRITINDTDFVDRIPASTNTLGFDVGLFGLNNPGNSILDNNQTSTTIRMTSNQEAYGLYQLGFSVEVWEPLLTNFMLTDNSGNTSYSPDEEVVLDLNIENSGNDDIIGLNISSVLSGDMEFVTVENLPTGATFNFDANTRVLNIQIPDEFVENGDSSFPIGIRVRLNNQCHFANLSSCQNTISLQARAEFTGFINTQNQSVLSSSDVDNCGLGNTLPTVIPFNENWTATWFETVNALDRTVFCDDPNALNDAQALEPSLLNCVFPLTKTETFTPDSSCSSVGTYTNTWEYTDTCGNTHGLYTQEIIVTSSPITVTTQYDTDVTTTCDMVPPVPTLEFEGGCGTLNIDYTEEIQTSSNTEDYLLIRTWTVTDDCSTASETFEQLVIMLQPDTVFISAEGCMSDQAISLWDFLPANSDQNGTFTYFSTGEEILNGEYYPIPYGYGDHLIEYSVSQGNCTQNYEITLSVNEDCMACVPESVITETCLGTDAVDLGALLPETFSGLGTYTSMNGSLLINGSQVTTADLPAGNYSISYEYIEEGNCVERAEIMLTVLGDCPMCTAEDIIISKTVTINGDGVNDYFEINSSENCQLTYNVQIFNRWGDLIFKAVDYQNDWDGSAPNNSVGHSNNVSSGTYFYIIDVVNADVKQLTGYIYVGSDQ